MTYTCTIAVGLATFETGFFYTILGENVMGWPILFSFSLFGYMIAPKNMKYRKILYLLFVIIWLSIALNFAYFNLNDNSILSKFTSLQSPIMVISAIGVVGLVYEINWTSKIVNYIVKHMYFIYEYHWIIYLLYRYVFASELNSSAEHEYIWITISTTFFTLIPISFLITKFQVRIDKKLSPWMEKKAKYIHSKMFQDFP